MAGPNLMVYKIPFVINIPHLVGDSSLPPSVKLGEVIVDHSTGNHYAQPCIAYNLSTVVSFTTYDGNNAGRQTTETFSPIVIPQPANEIPPAETPEFPAEFTEEDSHGLRRYLLGPELGTMTASMRESPSIHFSGQYSSSTNACLTLEFDAQRSSHIYRVLHGLTFTISSLVRVKTAYSLETSSNNWENQGATRLRDEVIQVDPLVERNLSWEFMYDMDDEKNRGMFAISVDFSMRLV
jgi:hypothetical protein